MLESSPRARVTVNVINAARTKLRMTPGPAISRAAADPSTVQSDGPADGDHGHLAGAELVPKCLVPLPLQAWGTYIPETVFSTKDIFAHDFRNRRGTRLRCRCRNRPLKSHLGYYVRYPCLSCQIRASEWTEPRSPDAWSAPKSSCRRARPAKLWTNTCRCSRKIRRTIMCARWQPISAFRCNGLRRR